MIGDLYNYVSTNIVGEVPMEFEFVTCIIVILFCILILYVIFSGFIFLHDLLGGK